MRKILTLILVLASISANAKIKDSVSYALGLQVATNLKQNDLIQFVDEASFAQAIKDIKANKGEMSDEKAQELITDFFTKQHDAIKNKNLAEGEAFLKANAKKVGVKETESGLQYKIVEQGTGVKPTADDEVKVHYEGTLLDGTIFDSSYKRGEPITFPLGRVIPGWTEGVQHVNAGGKILLYIHPKLAYGDRGTGEIKPNSTLIFTIELIEVNPAK